MANPPRTRKRVRVPRRAPDGSAFQKCDDCGASVPVALMDMHACQVKKEVKRFKGNCEPVDVKKSCFSEEPRSAFHFFLESYTKTSSDGDMLEINRQAFEEWKVMSLKVYAIMMLVEWRNAHTFSKNRKWRQLITKSCNTKLINCLKKMMMKQIQQWLASLHRNMKTLSTLGVTTAFGQKTGRVLTSVTGLLHVHGIPD